MIGKCKIQHNAQYLFNLTSTPTVYTPYEDDSYQLLTKKDNNLLTDLSDLSRDCNIFVQPFSVETFKKRKRSTKLSLSQPSRKQKYLKKCIQKKLSDFTLNNNNNLSKFEQPQSSSSYLGNDKFLPPNSPALSIDSGIDMSHDCNSDCKVFDIDLSEDIPEVPRATKVFSKNCFERHKVNSTFPRNQEMHGYCVSSNCPVTSEDGKCVVNTEAMIYFSVDQSEDSKHDIISTVIPSSKAEDPMYDIMLSDKLFIKRYSPFQVSRNGCFEENKPYSAKISDIPTVRTILSAKELPVVLDDNEYRHTTFSYQIEKDKTSSIAEDQTCSKILADSQQNNVAQNKPTLPPSLLIKNFTPDSLQNDIKYIHTPETKYDSLAINYNKTYMYDNENLNTISGDNHIQGFTNQPTSIVVVEDSSKYTNSSSISDVEFIKRPSISIPQNCTVHYFPSTNEILALKEILIKIVPDGESTNFRNDPISHNGTENVMSFSKRSPQSLCSDEIMVDNSNTSDVEMIDDVDSPDDCGDCNVSSNEENFDLSNTFDNDKDKTMHDSFHVIAHPVAENMAIRTNKFIVNDSGSIPDTLCNISSLKVNSESDALSQVTSDKSETGIGIDQSCASVSCYNSSCKIRNRNDFVLDILNSTCQGILEEENVNEDDKIDDLNDLGAVFSNMIERFVSSQDDHITHSSNSMDYDVVEDK